MVQLILHSLRDKGSAYAESKHSNNGIVLSLAVTHLIVYHNHELLISSNEHTYTHAHTHIYGKSQSAVGKSSAPGVGWFWVIVLTLPLC